MATDYEQWREKQGPSLQKAFFTDIGEEIHDKTARLFNNLESEGIINTESRPLSSTIEVAVSHIHDETEILCKRFEERLAVDIKPWLEQREGVWDQRIRDMIKNHKDELSKVQDYEEEWHEKYEKKEKEMENIMKQMETQKAQHQQQLRDKDRDFVKQVKQWDKERSELETHIQEVEQMAVKYEEAKDKADEERKKAYEDLNHEQKSSTRNTEALKELENTQRQILAAQMEAQAELEVSKAELNNKDKLITTLQNENSKLKDQIPELESTVEDLRDEARAKEEELKKAAKHLSIAHARNEAFENDNADEAVLASPSDSRTGSGDSAMVGHTNLFDQLGEAFGQQSDNEAGSRNSSRQPSIPAPPQGPAPVYPDLQPLGDFIFPALRQVVRMLHTDHKDPCDWEDLADDTMDRVNILRAFGAMLSSLKYDRDFETKSIISKVWKLLAALRNTDDKDHKATEHMWNGIEAADQWRLDQEPREKEELKKLRKETQSCSEKLTELEQAKAEVDGKLSQYRMSPEMYTLRLRSGADTIVQQAEKIRDLETRTEKMEALEKEVREKRDSLDEYDLEPDAYHAIQAASAEKIQRCLLQSRALEREIKRLKKELQKLRKESAAKEAAAAAKEAAAVKDEQKTSENLEEAKDKLQQHVLDLAKSITDHLDTQKKLEEQIQEKGDEIQQKQTELDECVEHKRDLERQLQAKEDEVEDLKSKRSAKSSARIEKLENEIEELKKKLQDKEAEIQKLDSTIKDLKDNLIEEQDQANALRTRLDADRSKMQEVLNENADKDKEIQELRRTSVEEKEALHKGLVWNSNAASKLSSENEKLLHENEELDRYVKQLEQHSRNLTDSLRDCAEGKKHVCDKGIGKDEDADDESDKSEEGKKADCTCGRLTDLAGFQMEVSDIIESFNDIIREEQRNNLVGSPTASDEVLERRIRALEQERTDLRQQLATLRQLKDQGQGSGPDPEKDAEIERLRKELDECKAAGDKLRLLDEKIKQYRSDWNEQNDRLIEYWDDKGCEPPTFAEEMDIYLRADLRKYETQLARLQDGGGDEVQKQRVQREIYKHQCLIEAISFDRLFIDNVQVASLLYGLDPDAEEIAWALGDRSRGTQTAGVGGDGVGAAAAGPAPFGSVRLFGRRVRWGWLLISLCFTALGLLISALTIQLRKRREWVYANAITRANLLNAGSGEAIGLPRLALMLILAMIAYTNWKDNGGRR
ncbi:uncharacterized protein JN550_003237 [Neoarthrinium moseri]|uniref:uncharacterized protein n=1 Tax=Neoarthrinium moseri TaxID=1658444 RepID=UPI001FDB395F|nr:uncharacterized protein JN550_003237 [Neoarthrinium moseri]KAI1873968.1 hypothetical protein JN550_003237 [Neoarthrinium moseri]